jgi:flagellar hook-basal body complex protein FliE
MAIPTITAPALLVTPPGVSPQQAAQAYRTTEGGGAGTGADFGALMSRAMNDAVQTGQAAETQAAQAIAGGGNLTEVVQAVSRAELTLQTATAIRDRVVQAYQDIMRMPI